MKTNKGIFKEENKIVQQVIIILYTFMLSERAAAFVTRGKMPYSANSPTKDDMKIYRSSSVTYYTKTKKKRN
ncbi:hypothetical protein HanPSC8_Chr01g0026641 [Helianthus annuus]|nr:hypothetical protein HanPSC8_Chr01g0026641 [Helianthus annuus]